MDFQFFIALGIFLLGYATATKEIEDFSNILKIPEACKNDTLCTIKPEGYDQFQKYLEEIMPNILRNPAAVDLRQGGEINPMCKVYDDDRHHCPYTKEEFKPYVNGVDNEVYIQTPSMQQHFTKIVCARSYINLGENKEECFQSHNFYTMHRTKPTCDSVSTSQTAYVFNMATRAFMMRQILIPSCCKCTLTDFYP